MAKVGEITLEAGRKLFQALGRRTANRWGQQQLADSFDNGLEELATDEKLEALEEEDLETYNTWAGCEELVIVVDEEPAEEEVGAEEAAEEAPAPAKKKVAKKKATKKAAKKTPAPAKKKAAKKAPAKKKAAAKKKATSKKDDDSPAPAKKKAAKKKAKGMRAGRTRTYIVGEVLAKYAGDDIVPEVVTQKMLDEADKAYAKISDKANPRETEFAMRNAWHVLRGYHGVENE